MARKSSDNAMHENEEIANLSGRGRRLLGSSLLTAYLYSLRSTKTPRQDRDTGSVFHIQKLYFATITRVEPEDEMEVKSTLSFVRGFDFWPWLRRLVCVVFVANSE